MASNISGLNTKSKKKNNKPSVRGTKYGKGKKPVKHFKFPDTGTPATDKIGRQLEKIFENTNLGSLETRHTNFEKCCQFVKIVTPKYKFTKLDNIQEKHLEYFAQQLKEENLAPKTIKNYLSAVRFMHKVNPNSKNEISGGLDANKGYDIESTPDGRSDRAWTIRERDDFVDLANKLNRRQIAKILMFITYTGCRLDEAATIRRTHLDNVVKTGHLYITNTKGGRPRSIRLSEEGIEFCRELMKETGKGELVFCNGMKIHLFKKSVQNFIVRHRDKIQDENRQRTAHNLGIGEKGALSAHGLRHLYARDLYLQLINEGYTDKNACYEVSAKLGHGRPAVTRIYLDGVDIPVIAKEKGISIEKATKQYYKSRIVKS